MKQDIPATLLAIDTSSTDLILGLHYGGDRLVKSSEKVKRSHGKVLVRKITNLISSADISKTDLDGIVVTIGPGSFTGLRIGLALAKGMAIALDIPLISVNLFELAARKIEESPSEFSLLLPLKSDAVFVAKITDGQYDPNAVEMVGADQSSVPTNGKKLRAIGFDPESPIGGALRMGGVDLIEYDGSDLIDIGQFKFTHKLFASFESLEPMYLQKSQAEIAFEKRHPKS